MNIDPVKPYADLMCTIALAVVVLLMVALLFIGGVYVGKGQSTKQLLAKDGALIRAAGDLRDAERALNGAGMALREVSAEAQRRIDAAALAKQAAEDAGLVAHAAQRAADKRMAAFDIEIKRARENPSCSALLRTDLLRMCGL